MPARRAPHLGEHTEHILGELGFTARDIDGLRAGGAVRVAQIPDPGFKRWPIWVWNHDLGEPGGQGRQRGHQQHRECRNYDVHGTSLDIGSAQGIVGETTPLRIALFGRHGLHAQIRFLRHHREKLPSPRVQGQQSIDRLKGCRHDKSLSRPVIPALSCRRGLQGLDGRSQRLSLVHSCRNKATPTHGVRGESTSAGLAALPICSL